MINCNKCVISMSGGLDSTCLALKMLAEGKEVKAYAFQYGQKHQIELEKLQKNIKILQDKKLPISLNIIDLKSAFSDSASSLCSADNSNGEIPKGDYGEENMKSTVVENRNIIFSAIIYGKALGWANKTKENVEITLGIHAGDHALYPDTTKESQEAAKHCFEISNWGSERVDYQAPFVEITKDKVLKEGIDAMKEMKFSDELISKILTNTHSCYDPDEKGRSCGLCGTCKERIEAFQKNGLKDPVEYQVPIKW